MAEGVGNPAQMGKKSHKDSGNGSSRGTYLLLKQDTEVIIEGLFKCLSESGTVAGAQGDKTLATATHRVLWLIHTSCQLHARLLAVLVCQQHYTVTATHTSGQLHDRAPAMLAYQPLYTH